VKAPPNLPEGEALGIVKLKFNNILGSEIETVIS
jgi:hypothetical protein